MLGNIVKIAFLCIVVGSASIPISFTINSSPMVVWVGNALGSLLSAFVVIYIGDRLTDKRFMERMSKHRATRKIEKVSDQKEESKKTQKAQSFINKHGLRIFSLLCPIFPGVLLSTSVVYILGLDRKTYKRWMLTGVVFISGAYVYAYWWMFVRVV